jgi:hypothetical protein
MTNENVGDQFVHVVGGALLKEAQNHVQRAINHVAKYTAPIYNDTPKEKIDDLWDHPLFGKISTGLELAKGSLEFAEKLHDQKRYDDAIQVLISAHRHMGDVLNADMDMAKKGERIWWKWINFNSSNNHIGHKNSPKFNTIKMS